MPQGLIVLSLFLINNGKSNVANKIVGVGTQNA